MSPYARSLAAKIERLHLQDTVQLVGQIAPHDDVLVVDGAIADRRFVAVCGRAGEVTAVVGLNRPALVMRWRARLARPVSWHEAILKQKAN